MGGVSGCQWLQRCCEWLAIGCGVGKMMGEHGVHPCEPAPPAGRQSERGSWMRWEGSAPRCRPFRMFGGIEPGQRASRQHPREGALGGGGDFELLQGTHHQVAGHGAPAGTDPVGVLLQGFDAVGGQLQRDKRHRLARAAQIRQQGGKRHRSGTVVPRSFPNPIRHLGGRFSTGSCQGLGTQHHAVEINLQGSDLGRDGRGQISSC